MVGGNPDSSEWGDFLNRRTAEGLEWARWAVERWSAVMEALSPSAQPVHRPASAPLLINAATREETEFLTDRALSVCRPGGCLRATLRRDLGARP